MPTNWLPWPGNTKAILIIGLRVVPFAARRAEKRAHLQEYLARFYARRERTPQ